MIELLTKLKNQLGLFHIEYFQEISSTQEAAREVAEEPPYLIVAGYQAKGKGRTGRSWVSETGGLYLTLVVKRFPDDWAVTITAAYLVRSALSRFVKDITLKWPNDLLYGKVKLAGTLAEAWGKRLGIGVGVNVNQKGFPGELEGKATSLRLVRNQDFDLECVLEAVSSNLVNGLRTLREKGFKDFYPGIRQVLLESAQEVRVNTDEGIRKGVLMDMNPEGCAEIKSMNGDIIRLPAGQILGGDM